MFKLHPFTIKCAIFLSFPALIEEMDGRGIKFENLFEANEFKQTAENSEFALDIEVRPNDFKVKLKDEPMDNEFQNGLHVMETMKWGGYVKFIYSEKATKFCEISTNYLTGST